ncbi:MAG: hypothetical protein R2707_17940 [Acidimicrobiales bacterium]
MNDTPTLPLRRLRRTLQANAMFSIVSGTTALIAGSWVSRTLGIDHVALTRVLGAGLVAFAAIVFATARADAGRLRRDSLLVSLADAGWVLGTVVVVTTGILTPTGDLVAVVIAVMVADFGTAQYWFRSRSTAVRRPLGAATV